MSWFGSHLSLVVALIAILIWLVVGYLALVILAGIRAERWLLEWVRRRF